MTENTIVIPEVNIRSIMVSIVGRTPLLTNKFSDIAKAQIEDKQQLRAKAAKAAREPEAEFRAALHQMAPDLYGFPSAGIKKALVAAGGRFADEQMTRLRVMENDRPRVTPAYRIAKAEPKTPLSRAHNVLHGESATAVNKAREAFDELAGWRARYQPFTLVWRDFAQAFRGVTNQIGEALDVVATAGLDDRTDAALSDLMACFSALSAWRDKHGSVASTWPALDEQASFVCEAIDDAMTVYTKKLKVTERTCLNCTKPFLSGGPGNRLCERCAGRSTVGTASL